MKTLRIIGNIVIVLLLIGLVYGLCIGEKVSVWLLVGAGLLVIAYLIEFFGNRKSKSPES